MRIKTFLVLVFTVIMLFSMTTTVFADANASWKAAKGTAVVDGQKDAVYSAAQEMVMDAVSDGTADGTAASAWAVYDSSAIYVFVEVEDSALDDTNANGWEKDSVEFRFENKDKGAQAFAVGENVTGDFLSASKVLKTDKGYNAEFKVPYAAVEGNSVKFSLQINAASGGKRNCTLHTNEDLKDAWQNNDVFENLVFSSEEAVAEDTTAETTTDAATDTTTEATSEVPVTGVISFAVLYGIGALATAAGATSFRNKKEK